MNGRVYDYNVGRFLGVDPFLQFPENSQGANPYSYIMNNPMAGTDPTGYIPLIPALIWSYAAYETANETAETYEKYENGEISGGDVAGAVVSSAVENTIGNKLKVAKAGVQKMRKAFKGDKPDTNVQKSKSASKTSSNGQKNENKGVSSDNTETGKPEQVKNANGKSVDKVEHVEKFDSAREKGFENAGLSNPSDVSFSKMDKKTGTVVEFKGRKGEKVAYDSPHEDMDSAKGHDKPHVGWQTGGKRKGGGASRGNITHNDAEQPTRPDEKDWE